MAFKAEKNSAGENFFIGFLAILDNSKSFGQKNFLAFMTFLKVKRLRIVQFGEKFNKKNFTSQIFSTLKAMLIMILKLKWPFHSLYLSHS